MNIESMLGKIFSKVTTDEGQDSDELSFHTSEGEVYTFKHHQDCCENVYIESIVGELPNLIGSPLLVAEESTEDVEGEECEMWTFYKFATVKGWVDVRWNGSSNGYYSVGVSLDHYKGPNG
jgi:hypothetical protein